VPDKFRPEFHKKMPLTSEISPEIPLENGDIFTDTKNAILAVRGLINSKVINVMFSFFVEGVLFKSMPCPITNRLFYDSIQEKKSNFEFHLY